MENVTTEIEALAFCKENQVRLDFRKEMNGTPEHVVLHFCWEGIIGKDLVEAVNRAVEMYHTAPCNFDKLPFWQEMKEFYLPSVMKGKR